MLYWYNKSTNTDAAGAAEVTTGEMTVIGIAEVTAMETEKGTEKMIVIKARRPTKIKKKIKIKTSPWKRAMKSHLLCQRRTRRKNCGNGARQF